MDALAQFASGFLSSGIFGVLGFVVIAILYYPLLALLGPKWKPFLTSTGAGILVIGWMVFVSYQWLAFDASQLDAATTELVALAIGHFVGWYAVVHYGGLFFKAYESASA